MLWSFPYGSESGQCCEGTPNPVPISCAIEKGTASRTPTGLTAALDKIGCFGQDSRMLRQLLQLCFVVIATMFLASELLACPHHAAEPQQVSDGTINVSLERRAEAEHKVEAGVSNMVSSDQAGMSQPLTTNPADLMWAATVTASGSAEPNSNHGCCGTSGCTHTGACAGSCCAATQSLVGAGGRLQERKLTFIAPHRPAMATFSLVSGPLPADGDRDRRRSRDAKAVRSLLPEPRLAQVVRLTI